MRLLKYITGGGGGGGGGGGVVCKNLQIDISPLPPPPSPPKEKIPDRTLLSGILLQLASRLPARRSKFQSTFQSMSPVHESRVQVLPLTPDWGAQIPSPRNVSIQRFFMFLHCREKGGSAARFTIGSKADWSTRFSLQKHEKPLYSSDPSARGGVW